MINSTWRNPERNEAVGGSRRSRHQYGNAVDLDITTVPNEKTSAEAFCILETAAEAVVGAANAFAERNAVMRPCNAADVTHVHVQQ